MKFNSIYLLTLTALLSCSISTGQSTLDSLQKAYSSYFELPNESIYLHINKEIFLYGENIWFTAYLYDIKKNKPKEGDTNLWIGLYDSRGKQLTKELYLVENGIAVGNFEITPEFGIGNFYIKASTERMSNFSENNAYIQKIQILDKPSSYAKNNCSPIKPKITLIPEGGTIIENTSNTFGFKTTDKNGDAVLINNGKITRHDGKIIISGLSNNEKGYGKFNLTYAENEEYYIELSLKDNTRLVEKLPEPKEKGITFSVNNSSDKFLTVTFRTNAKTISETSLKEFILAIHREGRIILKSIKMDTIEKSLHFDKKLLFSGINVITLFDSFFNPVGERIIYNGHFTNSNISPIKIEVKKHQNNSNKVDIHLTSKLKTSANLSISILPETTLALSQNPSPLSSLLFFGIFLKDNLKYPEYYFENVNRKRLFEFDLFLLVNGQSNYPWNDIFSHKKPRLFQPEKGINLAGKVMNANPEKGDKIVFYQLNNKNIITAPIGPNKEFCIENVFILKNDSISVSIMEKSGKLRKPDIKIEFFPTTKMDSIQDSNLDKDCMPNEEFQTNKGLLLANETIVLKNVEVSVKKFQNNLFRNPKLTTGVFEGVKISNDEVLKYRSLSNILRRYGFKVLTDIVDNSLTIQSKTPMDDPPIVLIDGFEVSGHLTDFSLTTVDEVYYEHMGTHGSNGGTIYIYRKYGQLNDREIQENSVKILPSQGFTNPKVYHSPLSVSYFNLSFQKFGSLNYSSNLTLEANQIAQLDFENHGINSFKVIIKGIAEDGTIISEERTIDLN